MRTFILSGFADEAGVYAERQMDVLEKNGVRLIETRGVDGGHVLDKTRDGLKELREKLDKRGFAVSAIGSPVGKSPIGEDFAIAKASFLKAVEAAKILGTRYVRAFSFYMPKGGDPAAYAGEVVRRLRELTQIAEDNGVIYALENESDIYTDIPSRCEYVFGEIDSPALKMVFDPANFIVNNIKPFPGAFDLLKSRIAYFHIKDATAEPRKCVASGEGESDMGALLAAAYTGGFDGVLSIEPHLGYLEELNDAQRFTKAANALKKVLNESLGVDLPTADLAEFAQFGRE